MKSLGEQGLGVGFNPKFLKFYRRYCILLFQATQIIKVRYYFDFNSWCKHPGANPEHTWLNRGNGLREVCTMQLLVRWVFSK
jgi:hypothetical protein